MPFKIGQGWLLASISLDECVPYELTYIKKINSERMMFDNKKIDRPSRKNIASEGMIYIGNEQHRISVKNISKNGVLVKLISNNKDIKYIFNQLFVSTIIELQLPDFRFSGKAEVVRADIEDGRILLALEFKKIA